MLQRTSRISTHSWPNSSWTGRGIDDRSAACARHAGTGSVVGNVTEALDQVFGSVAGPSCS
ncbi:hypothetical protein ACWEKR_09000 [Nocardia sp. NPDC004573]